MTKVRLSLMAVAFLLATGAAFATNKAKTDLPSCSSGSCITVPNQDCCIQADNTILKGEFVQ